MRFNNLITQSEVDQMFEKGMTLQHSNTDLILNAYIADGVHYYCVRDVVMDRFDLKVTDEPQTFELISFEDAGNKYSNGYRSLCQTLWKFDRPVYVRSGKLFVNPADLQFIYEQYSEGLKEFLSDSESPI
ncbi:hypothetical protein D0S45_03580 [Marinifilum sp. JC120]|nr:hypothetical protein D0S45_03580 [Marinifilum sp. JC120]